MRLTPCSLRCCRPLHLLRQPLSSLTPITWPPPSHPFSFFAPEVTGRARARRGSGMRVEPQTSDPAKEHSHHLSGPSVVLSVLRFCGKEDGGGEEERSREWLLPLPPQPQPQLSFINIHFQKRLSILEPPWKCDYFCSLHWPGCPRLHPSRNSGLRETGQSSERTVPGDELSLGQKSRGNCAQSTALRPSPTLYQAMPSAHV